MAVAWIAFGCGILQFGKQGWVLVDCVEVQKSQGIVVGLGIGFLGGPVDCRRSIGVGLVVGVVLVCGLRLSDQGAGEWAIGVRDRNLCI